MLMEEFEDTKGVIRIRRSKDRKHNGQKFENTKKSLKIPKRSSESVYRKRTDNRKRTKGETTIYKTYI
jgi:hypothetical protein